MANLGVLFPSSQTKAENKLSSLILSMVKGQEVSVSDMSKTLDMSPSSVRKLLEWIIRHQDMPKIVVVNGVAKRIE